jgi:hypothetical protein
MLTCSSPSQHISLSTLLSPPLPPSPAVVALLVVAVVAAAIPTPLFPPLPVRRLVSSSLCRLLQHSCPLRARWFGWRQRRKSPAGVWRQVHRCPSRDLSQVGPGPGARHLGGGVWERDERRMNGLWRLAALLLGITSCTLMSHIWVSVFLEGLI